MVTQFKEQARRLDSHLDTIQRIENFHTDTLGRLEEKLDKLSVKNVSSSVESYSSHPALPKPQMHQAVESQVRPALVKCETEMQLFTDSLEAVEGPGGEGRPHRRGSPPAAAAVGRGWGEGRGGYVRTYYVCITY